MNKVLQKNLSELLEQSEIDCLTARLQAIQSIEGNPMNVDIQSFGNATAFSAKNIPGPSFNTIKGITDEDIPFIADLIAFYNERGIPIRFELTPAHVSSKLLDYLNEKGFYHHDFHTTLYKSLSKAAVPIPSNIVIRELNQNEFSLFGELYTKGFQMPAFLAEGVAQNNEILWGRDGWHFYVAEVDDEPAGIGVLFIKEEVATMAAAATVPEKRNRGIQTAILQKRLEEAISQDCYLAVGQAKFGSVSHYNMERSGFQVGYTKAIWVKRT